MNAKRTPPRLLATAIALAFLGASQPAWTQSTAPIQPAATAQAAPTVKKPGAPASQQELDRLLAPIALYPDALLAQVLMASTYPLEVVMAARWSKENPKVSGKALEDAMQAQPWDPSVKAMTAVPQVLDRMSQNVEWTHKLGDAFLGDQKAVLATVQGLRLKAQETGNLKTTPEQTVRTEVQQEKQVIIIESAQPQTVYVPTYDPAYVYGPWWYGYPPYYMYPAGYYYGTGLAFATGIFVGAAIWGNCNWGGNNVHIDHHSFNNFNRTNVGNGNWNHNVDHRKGVNYGDNRAAQKFDRGGADRAESREQFRGRAETGRREMSGMDRNSLRQTSAGDRMSGGSRDLNAGSRDLGSGNVGGGSRDFGASSRDFGASSRDFGGGSRDFSRGNSSFSSGRTASVGRGGFGGRR
jgi:hypothetical protein